MSDVIKNYTRHVIYEKNGVGVLPLWASCPTLPYANILQNSNLNRFPPHLLISAQSNDKCVTYIEVEDEFLFMFIYRTSTIGQICCWRIEGHTPGVHWKGLYRACIEKVCTYACYLRADSRLAPSQWETVLLCIWIWKIFPNAGLINVSLILPILQNPKCALQSLMEILCVSVFGQQIPKSMQKVGA